MKNDLSPDILPRFTDDEIAMIKCTADFFPIDVSLQTHPSGDGSRVLRLTHRATGTVMSRLYRAVSKLASRTSATRFGLLATKSSETRPDPACIASAGTDMQLLYGPQHPVAAAELMHR